MAAPLGLAATASVDQLAVPAADAVVSGRLRGSGGGGGEGGWAGRGASAWTVSGASASGTGDAGSAGGAAITAPTKLTSSTVMNTKRTNRAAFVRAAWIMGRLRCLAGANAIASDAGPGWGETRPVMQRGNFTLPRLRSV